MFYKIEDAAALLAIDSFFAKRSEFYADVKKMCRHYGFDHHSSTDSIVFGIRFHNICFDPRDTEIDKTLWKTSKIKNSHMLRLLPRASAKKHKAEYDAMKPKPMCYSELTKLILAEGVEPWTKSYGFRHKEGEYFMFETSLAVSDIAVEILGSEYKICEVESDQQPPVHGATYFGDHGWHACCNWWRVQHFNPT